MRFRTFAGAACLLGLLAPRAAAPQSAAPRGVTPDDYYAFQSASDPRLSPDGSLVAYIVTTIDRKQNRRRQSIWMGEADGSRPPRPFTTSPTSSSAPRWRPDGRSLLFISARPSASDDATDSKPQAYLLPLDGGEARRVTDLKNGVSECEWSPDGKRLACLSRTGPADGAAADAKGASDVRHYTQITYKMDGSGWFDDRRAHVWVIDVGSGAAEQVTNGDGWNDSEPRWSPDGSRLAFVSDRSTNAIDWEGRNVDVWVVAATGGTPIKVSDHREADTSPAWSLDGKSLLFLGSLSEGDHPKMWLAPADGGAPSKLVSKEADLLLSSIRLGDAGRAVYFVAGRRGETHVFAVDVASGRMSAITSGPRTVKAVDVNEKAGRIAFVANDPTHLDNLYVADLAGKHERRLTALNEELWNARQFSPVERVAYKGADGWDIEAFFVRPLAWQEDRRFPMILNVHGGPNGMCGYEWNFDFQVLAARGYAVLCTNPRGSSGYGEAFQRAVKNEWGGRAYTDIMNGVEATLRKYPWIDRERLGVMGLSYGGFMTDWIVGHTTLFKAAVTANGISNLVSVSGTRDAPYNHRRDFGGDVFEAFQQYWDTSPLKYAGNVKTPTLVLGSESDNRVPLEQDEQWFRALKHFGAETEFVVFPRESHNLFAGSEPKHVIEALNWRLYWFDEHLGGGGSTLTF
jgi:dipeptidyl aminopeptidase/acylaminoacyl peptidase